MKTYLRILISQVSSKHFGYCGENKLFFSFHVFKVQQLISEKKKKKKDLKSCLTSMLIFFLWKSHCLDKTQREALESMEIIRQWKGVGKGELKISNISFEIMHR